MECIVTWVCFVNLCNEFSISYPNAVYYWSGLFLMLFNQILHYKPTGGQDDSENSTIYITGLTENATLPEMADFFKHCGTIRVRD